MGPPHVPQEWTEFEMYFQQFLRDDLGCASYLIGSPESGECAVVDPRWDVAPYLGAAQARNLRVTHVVETHLHADHLSGRSRLAAETGATCYIHSLAGARYDHQPLSDGEEIELGPIRLRCLHIPGHRPEHVALVVYDEERSPEPWLVLSGDSLLVGDVARPDLAVDQAEGAEALYSALRKIAELPDSVQLFPGHVAGSLCGRVTSAVGSSTVGYERRNNPAFRENSLEAFIAGVTASLPPRPPNMEVIVQKNRGDLAIQEPNLRPLEPSSFASLMEEGVVVLDARSPEEFGGGHLPESVNVSFANPQFANTAGWSIPPEESILLVTAADQNANAIAQALAAIGLDHTVGMLAGGIEGWRDAGYTLETIGIVTADELGGLLQEEATVVDVREPARFAEVHIPDARSVPFRELGRAMRELPKDRPIIAVCDAGYVSSVATKMLSTAGFDAYSLAGGMNEWKRAAPTAVVGAN